MAVQMDINSVGVTPITPIPCRCDTGSLVGRSEAGHSQFRNIFYWKRNLNQKFKTSKIIKLSTKPTWFPGGCWEKQRLTGGRITSSGLMDATLTPHSHCRCHICAKAVYNLRCHMNLAKNRAESGIARFWRLRKILGFQENSWDFKNRILRQWRFGVNIQYHPRGKCWEPGFLGGCLWFHNYLSHKWA